MKHLNKILCILLAAIALQLQAQTVQNPWALSFGVNAVGTSTSGIRNANDFRIPQLYKVQENWNIVPTLSYLGIARSVGKNLSFGIQGSLNKIEKFSVYDENALNRNGDNVVVVNPGDLSYFALDANIRYSFMSLIKSKRIDPSFRVGAGYNWIGQNNSASINAGPGLTFWFTELIGLEYHATFKSTGLLGENAAMPSNNYAIDMPNHFQHNLGLVFQFGAKDTDKDGICDRDDACPQDAGLKQYKGCPDSDGDGIVDGSDDCPNDFGLIITNGCPDKDGDGIADKDDRCPEFSGAASMKGCPDTDGDGIADRDDKCPKESGMGANGGCPVIDTDKDGVPDSEDDCPNVAGVFGSKGCPEPEPLTPLQSLSAQGKLVFFDSGKATFKLNDGETIENLDKMFNIIKLYPDTVFTIEGHTDSDGSVGFNQKLSLARANAVRNAMIKKGVKARNLKVIGVGESAPISTNDTPAGKAKNRRTEVKN